MWVRQDCWRYAGFNLLVVDPDSVWSVSNKTKLGALHLPRGLYGLSNVTLDTPNAKVCCFKVFRREGGGLCTFLKMSVTKPTKDETTFMLYSQGSVSERVASATTLFSILRGGRVRRAGRGALPTFCFVNRKGACFFVSIEVYSLFALSPLLNACTINRFKRGHTMILEESL